MNSQNKKKKFRKIRRGGTNHNQQYVTVLSTNGAGIKHKVQSLKNEINCKKCAIFTIQESHFKKKGMLKIDNFVIFEAIRKNKQFGGTIIGIHESLEPILIEEYSDEFELLVVEVKIANREIRIISGYGPQEGWDEEDIIPFYIALETEINRAEMAGTEIIIAFDANAKLGKSYVEKDPHKISPNGKILAEVLKRHALIVANGDKEKCSGAITRKRITTLGIEESIIDFVIFSRGLLKDFESMEIDEEKNHVLTRYKKRKKGRKLVLSDHNVIFTSFKLAWQKKNENKERIEMHNLKNKNCQQHFTNVSNMSTVLSNIFETSDDLDTQVERFLKKLNQKIHQCFNKIRIKNNVNKSLDELFNQRKLERSKLKENENDEEVKLKLDEIETELAEKCAQENIKIIEDEIRGISCQEGGINSSKLWGLKKKLFPKANEAPTAMVDSKGNLLTNQKAINDEAVKVFEKRLTNRKIKEGLEDIFKDREDLAKLNMNKAKDNKTKPWTMEELDNVLNYLKKSKSRDPYNLANEIFHPQVAGKDLKSAILKMMNAIKQQQNYPKSLELCNITSIYKRKGARNSFTNQRGIFRVTIFRTILDRLLYNSNYQTIDKNLTDSNVGARKKRNIRDNIFVVGAVINDVIKGKAEPIDITVYDVETCFDSMWLLESINRLHEAGLQNDHLPLLYLENKNAQVAVKTQGLKSQRVNIKNIIMQGSVWGSLKCTATMDSLGKFNYKNNKCYKYKGMVDVPSLGMVDDVLDINKCGNESVIANSIVNTFIDTIKLKLSDKKCHKIHIQKKHGVKNCPDLKVHTEDMHDSDKEKYLGEYIVSSGKLTPNIESRRNKANGIISDILTILEDIPLGNRKLEMGLKLREAMFVNGVLYSSEAWSSISEAEFRLLERCDERLLRAMVGGHSKAALEFIYMETGAWPLRWVVASRRLGYLHTLLTREEEELTKRVLRAQQGNPTQGDWWLSVQENMNQIRLSISENEILSYSKKQFSKLVKNKILLTLFKKLSDRQENHSKTKNIKYNSLETQSYLKCSEITNCEASTLFRLRSRTINQIKDNFRNKYRKMGDMQCFFGCPNRDEQEHITSCQVLISKYNWKEKHPEFEYNHIFGSLDQQIIAGQIFSRLLKIRRNILKDMSLPVASDWTSAHLTRVGAAGL